MFCNFCEKSENSKCPPFLVTQNFFENWNGYPAEIFCESKISSKLLYLAWFSRYKHFCLLQFLAKNSKIQNGHHFWRDKFFWKNVLINQQRYRGSKILSKSFYLTRFTRYKHFCVLQFLAKNFKIQNGRHF